MVRNTTDMNREEYNQKMDVSHLKRNLTLNLHPDNSDNKRKISPLMGGIPSILSSPDIKKFNLTTPDIEKMFSHSGVLQTPTPNTTSQLLFSKSMNDDQEIYPQEFVDALNGFPNESSRSIEVELPKSSSSSNSSISNNFMNIDQYPTALYGSGVAMSPDSVIIKDEPQTVPSMNSSPPLSPINMESQERIKLERKRLRNRVAASKCRRRKLERIAKLEEKVKLLKSENGELNQNVIRLKEEVCLLKQKVIRHVSNGCKIVLSSNFQL